MSRPSTLPEASAASPSASIEAVASARAAIVATALSRDSSELARERALLDRARKSSAHGDAASALDTAELHRRQFPKGRLAEEREALAIRALSSLGRGSEARERAQAFRATYPNSFLTGIVEAAAAVP